MSFPGHYEGGEVSSVPGPSSQPLHNSPNSRRPWSPLDYDDEVAPRSMYGHFSSSRLRDSGGRGRVRRQEASEDSVEALDLADYARTLRRPEAANDSPYPPLQFTSYVHPFSVPTPLRSSPHPPFASYPEYPPSPPPVRPFSVESRDTFMQPPPSLVSGESSYETHDSYATGRTFPSRRPYSLPSFLAPAPAEQLPHRGPAIFSQSAASMDHSLVRYASPVLEEPEYGDISKFPAYTQHWFEPPSSKSKRSSLPAYSDLSSHPLSDRSRNVLPWSSKDLETEGPPIDESLKQERMRMLEHEFGKKGTYENDDILIGSVDEKGSLITAGPKKRAAVRWAQGLFELTAVISSVYGALFIKTKTPAPPAGKAQAFILYGMSIISFLLTFYLFAVRPCCCGKRKKPNVPGQTMPGGLMVLPVQGPPGGKKPKKKGKKGKNGEGGGGDVQVNLIVDPGMFSDREEEMSGKEDGFDGSQVSAKSRRRGHRPRRSIFEGLAMQKDWEEARKFLKRMLAADTVCCLVWGAVFVFVLLGKKCPPGQFNGWCDSYNLATACACFLCLSFGFSIYFDISDLHASKASPRTRT